MPVNACPRDDRVEIDPGERAEWSVVWLHGLGADGHDFESVQVELRLPGRLKTRFVFPHAPVRPITINGGLPMRGWYDVTTLDIDRDEDREGIEASAALVTGLVGEESDRVGEGRVILAGFSQGGAVALYAGLRQRRRLAGIMALSAYLPLADEFFDGAEPVNAGTPIFLAHGILDPVVAFSKGRRARDLLGNAGYDVEWREYPIPHAVSPAEIADVSAWMSGVMNGRR